MLNHVSKYTTYINVHTSQIAQARMFSSRRIEDKYAEFDHFSLPSSFKEGSRG